MTKNATRLLSTTERAEGVGRRGGGDGAVILALASWTPARERGRSRSRGPPRPCRWSAVAPRLAALERSSPWLWLQGGRCRHWAGVRPDGPR